MGLYESFFDAVMTVDDYLWQIALVFIGVFGVYATIRYKGIQITHLKHAINLALGDVKERAPEGKITSFEAFCISMGARIGVGNIAGTATAIMAGGPGAIFWMWVFAVIGAASSFVETTIAQIYKERKSDGECYGGPAYYASKGFGSRKVGIVVAFIIFLMFAVGFAGIECCNAADALCGAFEFEHNRLAFAVIITLMFAPIALGGALRVAKVSAKVVPPMAFAWIIFAVIVILINIGNVPNAFLMIFRDAFDVPAMIGGGIGTAIIWGLKRGVFSNEAGIGTVTSVSAVADVEHPVKQGYIQSFGVLVDTFLICTMSALVILTFGPYESIHALGLDGVGLIQGVTASAVGDIARPLIAVFIFMFAFTCLVSDYLTSETNVRFIKDHRLTIWGLRIFLIVMVFCACMMGTEEMFEILDFLMAVTGIVNIILLVRLRRIAEEAQRDYDRQISEGVGTPVFHRSALSDSEGVTEWE
ncbi:MAG: alanine:cation symporter family protein [archaeon]|nr:alanine:cation symporter family protein [archaeon]